MLIIRKKQMDIFRAAAEERVRPAQVLDILQERWPDAIDGVADATLQERIAVAIARAARYGICNPADIGLFFVLMCCLSPRFDEHPAVHRLLSAESFAPDRFADVLREDLTDLEIASVRADGKLAPWIAEGE
jgi:hypothetical protein